MDWQQERSAALRHARRVVVKVGSAVLTGPQGLDTAVLDNIVAQLADLVQGEGTIKREVVFVSSGAVAAGRAALRSHNIAHDTDNLAARQGAAAVGQSRLMQYYDTAFASHGLVSAQVLLTRDDLRARQRFLNARNTFATLLGWGVVPIVNENDTVSVQELKFGDNDCLASLLVNLVEADLFVNLTSAPGVYAEKPHPDHAPAIMPCIESVAALNLDSLCGGKTSVGTGGMYSKLLAARRVAQLGVPTCIVPGRTPNVLAQAFDTDATPCGTWICAGAHAIKRRKFWLAYQSDPAGLVLVDAGASRALLQSGSSLLPVGVRAVEGTFQQGALVRVACMDTPQTTLGVGISNYTAGKLRRIMGLKRPEVAAILGDAHYPEVIHRDNLLLDPAL